MLVSVLLLQLCGEMFPLTTESIRVARWRCGRLYFDPSNESRTSILESVISADAGPEHVTGVKYHEIAVDERVDLALDEHVRLFEGVIVGVGDRGGLVIDDEHGVQLRAHLRGRSASSPRCRCRRASAVAMLGDTVGAVTSDAAGEPLKVHGFGVEASGVAITGVAHVGQ